METGETGQVGDNWDVGTRTVRGQQLYRHLQPVSRQHSPLGLTGRHTERWGLNDHWSIRSWKYTRAVRKQASHQCLYFSYRMAGYYSPCILQFIVNTVSYIPTCAISFWQEIRMEVKRLGCKYNSMLHYILYTITVLSETKCYRYVNSYIRLELCSKLVILNTVPR